MPGEDEAVTLALEPGSLPARLVLPLRVTVQGIAAVLVSAEAYDALTEASQPGIGKRSRIERDPELKVFVDGRLATDELRDIRAAAIVRFGVDRAPSSSALSRYAVARREAAAAVTRPPRGDRDPRRKR